MKYIKTNVGKIFEVVDKGKYSYTTIGGWKISFLGVLVESDRLEELFDEQIVEYKDKSGKVVKREFVNHIYKGKIPEGEPEYYGAVRTTIGLIYAARKIEGEWELI